MHYILGELTLTCSLIGNCFEFSEGFAACLGTISLNIQQKIAAEELN